jgi:predicted transcriptional regulator
MQDSDALNWREKCVLEAFENNKLLRFCDLPYMIGRSTIDRLVARGLVTVATPGVG